METIPLTLAKAKLPEVVDRVEREQDRVTITRNGRPVAMIVSLDDIEGLEETLEILSDKRLMRKLRAGTVTAAASPASLSSNGLSRRPAVSASQHDHCHTRHNE
jgi:prevent-host-death family protein